MFDKYRVRKLKTKVDVQRAIVDKLEIAAETYRCSYYEDKLHTAFCVWIELNSKLKWLEDRQAS